MHLQLVSQPVSVKLILAVRIRVMTDWAQLEGGMCRHSSLLKKKKKKKLLHLYISLTPLLLRNSIINKKATTVYNLKLQSYYIYISTNCSSKAETYHLHQFLLRFQRQTLREGTKERNDTERSGLVYVARLCDITEELELAETDWKHSKDF